MLQVINAFAAIQVSSLPFLLIQHFGHTGLEQYYSTFSRDGEINAADLIILDGTYLDLKQHSVAVHSLTWQTVI